MARFSRIIMVNLVVAVVLISFQSSIVYAGVFDRRIGAFQRHDFHDGSMHVNGRAFPCGRRTFSRESRKLDGGHVAAAIVGGHDAQPGEFPFIVSLTHGDQDKHFCGGSLIGPKHVLTASHCFEVRRHNLKVNLREYNIKRSESPPAMTFRPSAVIRHPSWNAQNYANDLAVVVLDHEFPAGDYAQLICLPSRTVDARELDWMAGRSLTVAGWGATQERGKLSPILQKLDVPVIENAVCRRNMSFAFDVTENQLCAGYAGGKKDACQGDSGGPLFRFDQNGLAILEGIVSAGIGCARVGLPGIYTRTAAYLPWIQGIMEATSPKENAPSKEKDSPMAEFEPLVTSTELTTTSTTTTGRAIENQEYDGLAEDSTGNKGHLFNFWEPDSMAEGFNFFNWFRQAPEDQNEDEPEAAYEDGDTTEESPPASITLPPSDSENVSGDDAIGRAYRDYRTEYQDYFSSLNKVLARLYPS